MSYECYESHITNIMNTTMQALNCHHSAVVLLFLGTSYQCREGVLGPSCHKTLHTLREFEEERCKGDRPQACWRRKQCHCLGRCLSACDGPLMMFCCSGELVSLPNQPGAK